MCITVLKTTFQKAHPKEIFYRDYKSFIEDDFREHLKEKLTNTESYEYETFETNFLEVLNKHAPIKKKFVRANHAPYMTKTLRKAIMRRSALENKYYKDHSVQNNKAYKKQKNFCSKLYKKERRKYYENLDVKNVTDNKNFWKTVKPLFSDKGPSNQNITLVRENEILSEDTDTAKALNNFFKNAVGSLDINENRFLLTDTENLDDPVNIAIKKFESHPSILEIKDNVESSIFCFTEVELSDIEAELNRLSTKKQVHI